MKYGIEGEPASISNGNEIFLIFVGWFRPFVVEHGCSLKCVQDWVYLHFEIGKVKREKWIG